MPDYKKPLPHPTPASMPFWEAAKRYELQIQRCNSCGAHIFYPREVCPECLASGLQWVKVSGKGMVYSFTIELAEGPRITTNIVGCKPEDVQVGMPVIATFDDVTPEMTLVKFRPA
jgi:uncharacterized OB-fold protein